MDSIPFLHADQIFTIFFLEDLAFTEVRQILDHLLDRRAFDPAVQEDLGEYRIQLEHASFMVWVSEMDVVIQKNDAGHEHPLKDRD